MQELWSNFELRGNLGFRSGDLCFEGVECSASVAWSVGFSVLIVGLGFRMKFQDVRRNLPSRSQEIRFGVSVSVFRKACDLEAIRI